MPNFDAQVRTSYRDVAGLVLSCTRSDIVEDVSNPGFVREWINRAPGLPSKPVIRQPGGAPPTYLGGRFSNPKQVTPGLQPTLALTGGGQQRCQFDRARTTFLETEFTADVFPDAPGQPMAAGYQFTKGGDVSNGQVIFTDTPSEVFKCSRRNGAGLGEVILNASPTVAPGDHADGTFIFTGDGGGTSDWQRDGAAYAAGAAAAASIPAASQLYLGRRTAGDYLDGTLDSIHLWMSELSPKTLDFIWQTLSADGVDYSTDLRPPMTVPIWTDLTGDSLLDQYDRLRPQTGFPHRYIKVVLPASPALHRVQVGCAVEGLVLPDSQLGGELFSYSWAEVPGPPVVYPVITQDAGWSAVADFDLKAEGHYTLVVERASGGSVVLHFDVEVG